MKKILTIQNLILAIIILFLILPARSHAQVTSSGIAISVELKDVSSVTSGSIICSGEGGYELCSRPYNTEIFGVVSQNPAAALEYEDKTNIVLVLTSGTAVTKVKASNGSIKKGNLITSSDAPGIGQLANKNGFVLGTALEDFAPGNVDEVGEINVALNIHPAAGIAGPRSELLTVLREGLSAPLFEPLASLRYILAALILLLAFILGFAYFGKVSRTGVEAIGRNPLATRMIQTTILLHIIITIVIIAVGFGMAYLILIL